jgi:hypothetical protein
MIDNIKVIRFTATVHEHNTGATKALATVSTACEHVNNTSGLQRQQLFTALAAMRLTAAHHLHSCALTLCMKLQLLLGLWHSNQC